MGLLKSLDDLLYEVMSWLIFWPLTLWRAVRHPLAMMRYADDELNDAPEDQYQAALSPPLFLLLSLVIAHILEIALVGDSPLLASRVGLSGFISNDTDLLAARMAMFSVFPLLMAVRALRSMNRPVTRDTLRQPFYAQCYAATPMALWASVAGTLLRMNVVGLQIAGVASFLVSIIWFVSVETAWFRRIHHQSYGRALGNAVRAYIEAASIVAVAGTTLA
ncbi:hypothetical protein [Sphingomonas antarctica]|uniref:hypothetical protein n=1 Tax=Sphingomonas antarctica TaxID=2040274 RepID=UPI0039ED230B